MADEKKKKKKSKKEDKAEEAPAEAAPAPEPEPVKKQSSRGSKKASKAGSNVFSMFSQKQIAEFKEGFQLMDFDKDGIMGKNDLRQTFDMIGRIATDAELDEYLSEASGPLSFTMLLNMFGERMSGGGGTDDDDVVIAAFKAFDDGDGYCDADRLRHGLCTWGEKFSEKECNTIFENLPMDNSGSKIDIEGTIGMLTAAPTEEEE